jgi:hypothetical protein
MKGLAKGVPHIPEGVGAGFGSGLASVEIDATRWAMDNLVFSIWPETPVFRSGARR